MAFLRSTVIAATLATSAVMATTAQAEYQYGFANIYADYLNWGNGFEDLSTAHTSPGGWDNGSRDEHFTLGIEGGAGFSWGEMYGFYEYEKINWASNERDQALKVSAHYRLAGSDFTVYGQVYDINDQKFNSSEQNRVIGLGYLGLQGDGWWFKPWVGYHDISVDGAMDPQDHKDVQGSNGGMLGWNAGYTFKVAGQPLMLTNWNEVEFSRNDVYSKMQFGETGLNGAIGLWYDINETFYTGIQYRYFQNKLGWDGYGDAMIYRIGIHL